MCKSLTGVHITDLASWCNIEFLNNSSNPLCCAENLYINGELASDIVIPNEVETIKPYAFDYCTSLTSITISESVTSIGEWAFRDCASLTSITILGGVTSIGEDAFDDCTSLAGVYITDLASWCNIDFSNLLSNPLYYAENLYINGELASDIVIPNEVETIKPYAFRDCTSLTSVTILDSVTSIGSSAFNSCT